jgi:hypothetical protein
MDADLYTAQFLEIIEKLAQAIEAVNVNGVTYTANFGRSMMEKAKLILLKHWAVPDCEHFVDPSDPCNKIDEANKCIIQFLMCLPLFLYKEARGIRAFQSFSTNCKWLRIPHVFD